MIQRSEKVKLEAENQITRGMETNNRTVPVIANYEIRMEREKAMVHRKETEIIHQKIGAVISFKMT